MATNDASASGSSSSTTLSPFARLKPKKPLDVWSTREKLCLASAVFKIGDQNWVSVSRAIKPYAEPNHPTDWFHQKNCVLQYYDMMEQLEHPKRKRGGDKSEDDTPSLQIMRRMTIERSEQLKKEIMEMQQTFKNLKSEVNEIDNGEWDDKLQEEWEKIEEEELLSDDKDKIQVKEEDIDDDKILDLELTDILSVTGELDDTAQESVDDISLTTDDDSNLSQFLTSTPVISSASTPTTEVSAKSAASHLLSSLLKSEVKTATGLQQLKQEQEQDDQQEESNQSVSSEKTITQDNLISGLPTTYSNWSSITDSSTKDTRVEASVSIDNDTTSTETPVANSEILIEETVIEDMAEIVTTEETVTSVDIENKDVVLTTFDDINCPVVEMGEEEVVTEVIVKEECTQESVTKEPVEKLDVEGKADIKQENEKDSQEPEEIGVPLRKVVEKLNIVKESEMSESLIKDEPLSPTSSISSRISETGSKRGSRGKGRPKKILSPRMNTRKSFADDVSSKHSDNEMSDDEVRESDIGDNLAASMHGSSILSESFPNSPASLSMCSDTEEEKSFKQWKKSIMLVWKAAAAHRFANVFLHPVTNDIARGYLSVVLRPLDLTTIKKHIETGIIRTTVEFQRDMMLMFTNAIMYNSSDHNVYRMATAMYDDVMTHIEVVVTSSKQYVNTQMMMQSTDSKNLRQSRRPENSDKEDDSKKRRPSVDQLEGGKTKKRKRLDETLP